VRDAVRAALPVYKLLGAAERLVAIYPDVAHSFPPEARAAAYAFLERHVRDGKGGESDR
jgi:hypothetical protein